MSRIKDRAKKKGKHIKTPTHSKSTDDLNPVFCFQYLHSGKFGVDGIEKEERAAFVKKICKQSKQKWKDIRSSGRNASGYHSIPRRNISKSLPNVITPEVELICFRYNGRKTYVGYRSREILHILFIDPTFELYDHE